MLTKNEKVNQQIQKHGENLLALFPNAVKRDPVQLSKALHRIEVKYHREAEAFANGEIDGDMWDIYKRQAKAALRHELGDTNVPVIINADPRGYALKIDDAYMREYNIKLDTDLGGYGLIAPKFD